MAFQIPEFLQRNWHKYCFVNSIASVTFERNLAMPILKILFFPVVLSLLVAPVSAQNAVSPNIEEYEDVGQGLGMVWHYHGQDGAPVLEFGVKETNHRLDSLWEFTCANFAIGSGRISNTIFASPPEADENDEFGFSIRVDDGNSIGLIGRKDPFQIQGNQSYFPQFQISDKHKLWDALRGGERAFVNLNGNKFSIHLKGSADAIDAFFRECRKNTDQ